MFRGGRNDGLPIASYSNKSKVDGSGRSIRMEAPLARSIRLASWQTKGAFITIAFSILSIYWGFCHLRHSSASISLTCHAEECELQICPPSSRKKHLFTFGREQVVKSQAIKVTSSGDFVRLDTGATHRPYKEGKKYAGAAGSSKGPDENGHYDDYTLVLRPPNDDKKPDPNDEEAEWFEKELTELAPFTYREEASGNYVLHMRKFNLGQSMRRSRTLVTRLESYINKRRHKLVIKENAALSWKGMLALVLGLFSLLIGILVWQFAEDEKAHKSAARKSHKTSKPSRNQANKGPVPNHASQAPPTRKAY